MSHGSLPTVSDVTSYLANLPTPISVPGGFDVASRLSAAIDDWNQRTGYRPFFQTSSTAQSIPFNPPGPDRLGGFVGGDCQLLLTNGLLSCTSVVTGVDPSTGLGGSTLIQGADYWLEPALDPNVVPAPPYTSIMFAYVQRGQPQSIIVTGVWGYCTGTIPDGAWEGILLLAVANTLAAVREGLMAGLIKITDIDQSDEYDPALLLRMGRGVRGQAERYLYRYRLEHSY